MHTIQRCVRPKSQDKRHTPFRDSVQTFADDMDVYKADIRVGKVGNILPRVGNRQKHMFTPSSFSF
jgi:hypothetical protein